MEFAGNQEPIVVMGVSGCGKSTVGARLAERLGYQFFDGDDFHPPANVARMASGTALRDKDRQGWLVAIGREMHKTLRSGHGCVFACSALRRHYRDTLRTEAGSIMFVHLAPDARTLAQRMDQREQHFMPLSLLASQLATLEPLQSGERGLSLTDGTVNELCDRIISYITQCGDLTMDRTRGPLTS